ADAADAPPRPRRARAAAARRQIHLIGDREPRMKQPPEQRRQPLPDRRPKPGSEDPEAPAKTTAIVDNPNYRRPDRDPDFLQRADMRGVRLMLDYLKPQTLLNEHDVAHTIVVFGSTRIPEPAVATRAAAALTKALAAAPKDAELKRRLDIARRIEAKSRDYDVPRQFGRLGGGCGDKAIGGRIMIMTVAGPGIMDGANRGAWHVGSPSNGLN